MYSDSVDIHVEDDLEATVFIINFPLFISRAERVSDRNKIL